MSTETTDDGALKVDLALQPQALKPYLDALDKLGAAYHFVRTDFNDQPRAMKLELWVDTASGQDEGLVLCLFPSGTWTVHKTIKVGG